MTEPKAVAEQAEEIRRGLWHVPEAMNALASPAAILLTTSSHQRSWWRLRREAGVQVYAPALVKETEEEPDVRYSEGDLLPGDLLAIFTPGAGTTQHSLLFEGDGGVAFAPDLFVRPVGGALAMTPAQYMHDPEEARRSAEKLLGYEFDVLCHGHGVPVVGGAGDAVRAALSVP